MLRRHEPVPRRDVWIWSALFLLLGALLWSVWADLDDSVLCRVPLLDEAYYLQRAVAAAAGPLVTAEPFYMSPLYPYLVLAAGGARTPDVHHVLTGPPLTGLHVVQALMWLATAWLLRLTGRRLLPGPAAWLPAALFLLYRPGVIYLSSALLEIPLTFAVAALLYAATVRAGADDPPAGQLRFVSLGLLAGVAALLRGHILLLLPAVLWAVGRPRRRRPWPVLAAVVAAVLLLTPFIVHNSRLVGRPAGPSLNAGVNLFIGNGSGANGLYRGFSGFNVDADPTGAAELRARLGEPIVDAGAADRAWAAEARRAVLEDPWRTLRLWGRKVWLHFVAAEFPQISSYDAWLRTAPWLGVFFLPWGVLSVGGLVGAALLWRRDRRWRLWIVALCLLVAAQSAFFVVSRYRMVLAPCLALLSAGAVVELWRARGRTLAVGLVVAALAACAVQPWGLGELLARLGAAERINEAVRWQHLGESAADGGAVVEGGAAECWSRSAELYREAVAGDPLAAQAYRGLAQVLFLADDADGALAALREGAGRARPAEALRRDLADLLLQRGDVQGALPVLLDQLRAAPDDPHLLHNTCIALSRTGRAAEAEATARHFVAAVPDDARAWIDLGVVLAQSGRLEAAREVFVAGLRHIPDQPGLIANLARVEGELGERTAP